MLRQAVEWAFLELSFASSHRPKTTFAKQEVVAARGLQKFTKKTAADTALSCQTLDGRLVQLKHGVESDGTPSSHFGVAHCGPRNPGALSRKLLAKVPGGQLREKKRRLLGTLEPV